MEIVNYYVILMLYLNVNKFLFRILGRIYYKIIVL